MKSEVLKSSKIVVAKDNVWCDVGGEAVVLNVQSGIYYGLNSVGARVWNLIQRPTTVNTLLENLLEAYEVAPERCEGDLICLLQDLVAKNLIMVNSITDDAPE